MKGEGNISGTAASRGEHDAPDVDELTQQQSGCSWGRAEIQSVQSREKVVYDADMTHWDTSQGMPRLGSGYTSSEPMANGCRVKRLTRSRSSGCEGGRSITEQRRRHLIQRRARDVLTDGTFRHPN